MKEYYISIYIKGDNFLFHNTSQDIRAEQVLALLDAIDKNVKPELLNNMEVIKNECK